MRYFIIMLVFVITGVSCKKKERDFFKSIQSKNVFLDTFSLLNLKGFGLSIAPFIKANEYCFEFNNSKNSIYITGAFYEKDESLFFFPENSNSSMVFLDKGMWDFSNQISSQEVTTKDNSVYEVSRLGLKFNQEIKDSTIDVGIRVSGMSIGTQFLIFEISKELDVLKLLHINCKNDTLVINFFPQREVYYRHLNESTRCL